MEEQASLPETMPAVAAVQDSCLYEAKRQRENAVLKMNSLKTVIEQEIEVADYG